MVLTAVMLHVIHVFWFMCDLFYRLRENRTIFDVFKQKFTNL